MIFIPFFRKIDWKHPPLITLLLILLNCFIFMVFQDKDQELTEQAYQFYLKSALPDIEITLYAAYLKQQNDWEKAGRYQEYLDTREDANQVPGFTAAQKKQLQDLGINPAQYRLLALVGPMLTDVGFQEQLASGALFPNQADFASWQTLHHAFESRLNKVVTYRHGLKPSNPTITTLFSNMFLHGGYDHLIGNMIFLFIIGFVVEAALGKTFFSVGYLLAGLLGGILYVIANPGSNVPTVGASGAIAGLMGMYTVLFGLRKINFFYYVLVYFDYVKAPAIILLPIWLGYQLIEMLLTSNSGVNYFAHIGGICSGALFAYVMMYQLKKVNIDYLDQDVKEEEKQQQFETAMDYLAKMQIHKALPVLKQLCNEHPQNREYLLHWYKAAKMQPETEDYHEAAKRIMLSRDKNPKTYQLIHDTYLDYMKIARPKPKMNAQLCLHLILVFALGRYFEEAENLLRLIRNHKMKDAVAEAILVLANAFQKANHPDKCATYLNMVTHDFSNTTASAEAARRLHSLPGNSG